MKWIFVITALILITGCTNTGSNVNTTSTAIAEAGDTVSVHYTGTFDNGEIFDSSVGKEPLTFVVGSGQMIKGFDAAVVGMREGENKLVTIPPEDAYGYPDPEKIIEVPKNRTPENVKAGDVLYAGSRQVTVLEVKNETVVLDTNPPVVGKNLTFEITMIKIEKG
jgi:peptidylprolyl isomerase